MTLTPVQSINPKLPYLFHDSTLGLYLDEDAPAVFSHGRVQTLAPGAQLPAPFPRQLHVLLDGRIAGPRNWYGPGNHLGGEEAGLCAVDGPARVWSLDLDSTAWRAPGNRRLARALTHALIAADAAEAAATPPAILPDPETLCDFDHPEIRRRAARLRRTTPAGTAAAIFHFVQAMPYRFGAWQERASDTLARGIGMCTTKANLQVALMRAAGLEAGFVETPMPISKLGRLMPDAWLALMRTEVRHYFAAVKLHGRWHGADASYDDASFGIYLETMPELSFLIPAFFDEGRPYVPAHASKGLDDFAIEPRAEIVAEMGKKSRFLPRHFEALNTRLDRTRGTHRTWGALARVQAGVEGSEARA